MMVVGIEMADHLRKIVCRFIEVFKYSITLIFLS